MLGVPRGTAVAPARADRSTRRARHQPSRPACIRSPVQGWTDGSRRTPYPCQVAVEVHLQCPPLKPDAFLPIIRENLIGNTDRFQVCARMDRWLRASLGLLTPQRRPPDCAHLHTAIRCCSKS